MALLSVVISTFRQQRRAIRAGMGQAREQPSIHSKNKPSLASFLKRLLCEMLYVIPKKVTGKDKVKETHLLIMLFER
jgi:hypothetical protein